MDNQWRLVWFRIVCSLLMAAGLSLPVGWYLFFYPMQFLLLLTSATATDPPPTVAWTKLGKVPFRAKRASELYADYWEKRAIAAGAEENAAEASTNITTALEILRTERREHLKLEFAAFSENNDYHEKSLICDVVASTNGSIVITASGSGLLRMWDARSGTPIGQVMRHPSTPRSLAISPDNACIAAAFGDGSLHLWSAPSGEPKELATVIHDARAVAFHPTQPNVILVGTHSGDLFQVNYASNEPRSIRVPGAITQLVTSPKSEFAIVGCDDGGVYGIDITTLDSRKLYSSKNGIRRIYRASNGTDYLVCDLKYTATALSLQDAQLKRELVHDGLVTAASYDSNGIIHTGTIDGTLVQWQPSANTPTRRLPLSHRAIIGLSTARSDGAIITAGLDGSIWRVPLDYKSPSMLATMPGGISASYSSASGIGIIGGFEGLAKIILTHRAGVLDIKQGYELYTTSGDSRRIAASTFFGDVTLMTGAKETIAALKTDDVVTCMAFSPDNSMLGVGQLNGRVRIYRTMNGTLQVEKLAHTSAIRVLLFTETSDKLLIVSADGGASTLSTATLAEESAASEKWVTAGAIGILNDHQTEFLGRSNGSLVARDFNSPRIERLGMPGNTPIKAAVTALVDMGKDSVLVGDEHGSLAFWSPITGETITRGLNHRSRINAVYRDESRIYAVTTSWIHVYNWHDQNLTHISSRVLPGKWRGPNCGFVKDRVLKAILLDKGGDLLSVTLPLP